MIEWVLMTEIQTHHSTSFIYNCIGNSNSYIHTGTRNGGTGRRYVKVNDDEIYTGEFVDKTPYDALGNPSQNPRIEFLKRKAIDTYVFLKDYKPKIKKIDSVISHLEKNVKSFNVKFYYRDMVRKKDKEEFNKEIDVVNGLVNDVKYDMEEQKELLEEQKDTINKLQSFILLIRKDFNEKIEKLEKKVYNLENPPLIPELKNPFDYFD